MSQAEQFVLGLDVGWSTVRRSSAACLLGWNADAVRVAFVRFTAAAESFRPALTELIGGRSLSAVALDGPLRGDLAEIGRYRAAEMLMTRGLARHIGKPGQSNSPNGIILNRAANAFAHALLDIADIARSRHRAAIHDNAIVEAFPTSFLGSMLDHGFREPGKARSDSYFMRLTRDPDDDRLSALIGTMLPGSHIGFEPHMIRNHDERAALVCAVTALGVTKQNYTAVGDDQGYIILPPRAAADRPGIQDWAWAILEANAGTGAGTIIREGPSLPDRGAEG